MAPDHSAELEALARRPGRSADARRPDAVNQAMIRHWVEAMGDENPVYGSDEAARADGFDGVIAPPTMLQAWIMRGLRATLDLEVARASGRPAGDTTPRSMMALCDDEGLTSVVATNCEQDYDRPLVLGDRLVASSVIEVDLGREADRTGCRALHHHPPRLRGPARGPVADAADPAELHARR